MSTSTLLPDPSLVRVEYVATADDTLCLHVVTRRASAPCPDCGAEAQRVHSRYRRTVADQPWNGLRVRFSLGTRRWFCDQPECSRRIFTERLPGMVPRYARRTAAQTGVLRLLAYILGGEAGARVAAAVGMPVSADTMLRQVRERSPYQGPAPRVLGVDDFAWRRGQRYGTLLVDLETGEPVDLLRDRTAASLATWLQEHPGAEVISRDRGGSYAEGARQGAPHATQVADRWHLLKNLTDALGEVLAGEAAALHTAAEVPSATEPIAGTTPDPPPVLVAAAAASAEPELAAGTSSTAAASGPTRRDHRSRREQEQSAQARRRRLAVYEEVVQHAQSHRSERDIARQLGISRGTVHKYLGATAFPERKVRKATPGRLTPYMEYLQRRWAEGCHNATQLWRELREQGYCGQALAVVRFMRRYRDESLPGVPPRDPSVPAHPSPRAVVWWLLCPERCTPAQVEFATRLVTASARINLAHQLVVEFFALARERRGQDLEEWVTRAAASGIAELTSFATGLQRDWPAVVAGLTVAWSNGPVEGHVNRLKLLKRQMYGRASFDLLRARVLRPG